MLQISGTRQEIDDFINKVNLGRPNDQIEFSNDQIEIIEMGSITDEELDSYRKFSDYEKDIIKKAYSRYPKGTFPNPGCALY